MLLDGEPIINIPPKTIQLSKIDFTKEERAFYLYLEESSRQKLKVVSSLHSQFLYFVFFQQVDSTFPHPPVVLHDKYFSPIRLRQNSSPHDKF